MAELEKALVAAQAVLANPPKTSTAKVATKTGGSYSYTYAPLPEILDAVRPALYGLGLAISQEVVGGDGYVGIVTTLLHSSGERLVAGPVLLAAADPQAAGAAITYLRRYSLCAILGIAADEDTDANVKASPKAVGPAVSGGSTSGPAAGEISAKTAPDPGPDTTSGVGEASGSEAGEARRLPPPPPRRTRSSRRTARTSSPPGAGSSGTPTIAARGAGRRSSSRWQSTTADLGPA